MLLHLSNLQTHFSTGKGVVKAVDGIDLTIEKGQTLGLVGESGCGKSVTALSVMRLVPPPGRIVGGNIRFHDKELLTMSDEEIREIRGKSISMIFQDPMTALDPIFTVGSQVADVIRVHQGTGTSEARKKAKQLLRKVRIPDAERRYSEYPHQFSGGMRQRVTIAMSISCVPELLIADEPTTNLDVTVQAQILDLMRGLKTEYGSSILLITHDLGIVAEMCNVVAVMYAGKIVEYADVESIFASPKHPYTRKLLSVVRSLEKRSTRLDVIRGTVPDMISIPAGCRFHPRCEFADEECRMEVPELRATRDRHLVSCLRVAEIERLFEGRGIAGNPNRREESN